MDSTMTCFVYLSMEDFHQRPTIYFWVTTWIEENSHWKPSVYSLPTRSSTQKTFSSSEETTSVHQSIVFMDSTMNVSFVIGYRFESRLEP